MPKKKAPAPKMPMAPPPGMGGMMPMMPKPPVKKAAPKRKGK